MTVHNCHVEFDAGFSLNPNFRLATASRRDLNAIATRLSLALDGAYLGKAPDALLVDHINNVRVAKITRGRKGDVVGVPRSKRGGRRAGGSRKK